jgi:signal transduction histidine kinase
MAAVARNIRLEVQLIDDLLDVTKITKGKLVLNPQVVSTMEILNHSLEIVQADANQKSIQIKHYWE